MNFLLISDLHIQSHGDDAYLFFKSFVKCALESDVENIAFLGDIFDIMVGSQPGYISDFPWYFEDIERLLNAGKNLYYFEGNHDFHLDLLFEKYFKNKSFLGKFVYQKEPLRTTIGGKSTLLMHGDDLDLDKEGYKKWKSIYTSGWFRFTVNNLLPYFLVRFLANKASSDSKKRNSKFFNYEAFKQIYRDKAQLFFNDNETIDVLIAGHTHIKDDVMLKGKQYINAGFPRRDRTYISATDSIIELIEIRESYS